MIKNNKTSEVRDLFINYFKKNKHSVVPSSPLVPQNDPTLLFVNAGMVQFKETFLGVEQRPYTRATSSQRCVRAGGKHNDLDQVGYTKRHHTFFEMLGNFSFGDYFKREAIQFAWEFLTEDLQIPAERLWVTVFREDQESEDIWLDEMKIDPKKFSRCGEKDNFWSMGDTGPCGPCTEIFYDHGPDVEGGPPGTPEEDGDRYVEIWNLVFMQYNRDVHGELTPLPKPCVDTGMGLERIATVIQGVHDNYDIDLFQHLLRELSKLVDCKDFENKSMRVIVDHIRSTAFLIIDGVHPSNEGRGYVLRRIIRRAVRHGCKLGQNNSFFYKLTQALVDVMGGAYPELKKSQKIIEEIIQQEEEQFSRTLEKGLKILDQSIAGLKSNEIPGKVVFQLYDTYGFPPDLTADIAREQNLILDYTGFEEAMAKQREMSQASAQFAMDPTSSLRVTGETEFTGYERMIDKGQVTLLLADEKPVLELVKGEPGIVVLDRTPFYAESGGQVGDRGYLYFDEGHFRVTDTKKQGKAYLHFGEVQEGVLKTQDKVRCEVDESRKAVVLNHSATHLLHEALRRVLGEHVVQKGSLVESSRLRFDFSNPKPLTPEELTAIERLVNQEIRANISTDVTETTIEGAQEMGALALFGERYAEKIRVVKMGAFSMEVCGGTHVHQTGDIGLFKITSEAAVAAGVRRIEAVTGNEAILWVEQQSEQLRQLSGILKASRDNVVEKLQQLADQSKVLSKEVSQLKQKLAHHQSGSLVDEAVEISGVKVLAMDMGDVERDTLRETVDKVKQQLGKAAVILASTKDDKIILVSGVSKDCLSYFNATELLNQVAHQVGGKGGGRPDMAQGGGTDLQGLPGALQSVSQWVEQRIKTGKD